MNRTLMTDLALAPIAGYVGTKIMEPVGAKLYELESEQDRQREDAARPGPPYAIAARKTADLLGLSLTDKQHQRLALAFHYGLAVQWAPLYPVLRRKTALRPVAAGLATGAAMSLIADETMTPALGFSAPNAPIPSRRTCGGSSATWCSGSASPPRPRPAGGCCAAPAPDLRPATTPVHSQPTGAPA